MIQAYIDGWRKALRRCVMATLVAVAGLLLSLDGVSAQVTTDVSAQATTNGAYSTSVKIEVPSFHGIEPQISLLYNSNAGMGLIGRGWDLHATSYITRASLRRGVPKYDSSDIFLLDGMELIPCGAGSTSPSCTTGGTHSTKIENFKRIKQDTVNNQWVVWEKNGTKIT